jgi:hypothetical protein
MFMDFVSHHELVFNIAIFLNIIPQIIALFISYPGNPEKNWLQTKIDPTNYNESVQQSAVITNFKGPKKKLIHNSLYKGGNIFCILLARE